VVGWPVVSGGGDRKTYLECAMLLFSNFLASRLKLSFSLNRLIIAAMAGSSDAGMIASSLMAGLSVSVSSLLPISAQIASSSLSLAVDSSIEALNAHLSEA